MILYLTSSPCIDGAPRAILNPANGFLDRLRADLPNPCRCLFIASDPDDPKEAAYYGSHMFSAFAEAGLLFSSFQVLSNANALDAAQLISESDLILLAGGHVPTQNRFFRRLKLGSLLQGFPGVVLGISAGSMNAAATVYAQPELPGESIDPGYQRFLPGLGLTNVNVCPHYQKVKNDILDGKRLFEDITYPDSQGRSFYALPDGSYFYIHEGDTLLCGKAYRIRGGILELLTLDGEFRSLDEL